MDFFGISFTELLVLAALAFILFGPEKLPEYAEKAGRLIARLRQATSEATEQYRKPFQEAKESFRSTAFPPPPEIPFTEPTSTPPMPEEIFHETTCPKCQNLVDGDFHFCPSCGHNLKEAEESPYFQTWKFPCPYCQKEVTREYAFCPECGHKLEESLQDVKKSQV